MRIKQPQHIIAVLKRNPPNSSRPILCATTVCCDILHLDVVHLRKMLGMVSWALSLWIARDIWWFHEEFFCKANAKPDNSKGTPSSLISQLESSSASVSAMKTLSSLWKGGKNVVLWAFFLTNEKKTERLIAGYVMICFKYVAIVDTDAKKWKERSFTLDWLCSQFIYRASRSRAVFRQPFSFCLPLLYSLLSRLTKDKKGPRILSICQARYLHIVLSFFWNNSYTRDFKPESFTKDRFWLHFETPRSLLKDSTGSPHTLFN